MTHLILQDVIVAIQQTRHTGQVRNHRRDPLQVDAVHRDGEILLHCGVLILCIDLNTRLIVGYQVDIGLDMFVAGQEDIVVLIEIKLLITDGGTLGQQFETQTVGLHLCRRPDTQAQLIILVEESQACQCPMAVEMTIYEAVEHKLRVLAVVAHLALIGESVTFMDQTQPDGIDTGAVIVQRVDMTCTVDTCLWRGGQVETHFFEVDTDGSEEIGHRVLAFAFQMELHHRK